MKTTTVNELLRRANESLTPEVATALNESFPRFREAILAERNVSGPVDVERIHFTSQSVKFEVDPNQQKYK